MAGWPVGYSATARAAALQARANSVSRVGLFGRSGVAASLDVMACLQVLQRIDVDRLRIDRFDHGARVLAAAVALPRVGEQRLLEHLALRVR